VWRICSTCGVRTDDRTCPEGHGATELICEDTQFPGRLQPDYLLKGQYKVDTLIGVGGMGAVYRAEHHLTNQNVAVKVLWQDLSQTPAEVKRFTREARAASVLAHPNSVRVFDFGTDEETGAIYIVMEFLNGQKLSDVLRDEPVLDPGRAVHIAAQVCKALEEAHGKGLIHRDLKPDNIFLQEVAGERDFVKVLDFGLAKFVSGTFERDNLTKTGYVVGSPEYMAPEQAIGSEVGPSADIYSVGVMLYEVLTGDLPFDAETTAQVLRKHIMEQPAPMEGQVDDDVPDALVEVVMRCLSKDPNDRPPTADTLRIQLLTAYDRRGRNAAKAAAALEGVHAPSDDADTDRSIWDTDEHDRDEFGAVQAPSAIGGSVQYPDGQKMTVAHLEDLDEDTVRSKILVDGERPQSDTAAAPELPRKARPPSDVHGAPDDQRPRKDTVRDSRAPVAAEPAPISGWVIVAVLSALALGMVVAGLVLTS